MREREKPWVPHLGERTSAKVVLSAHHVVLAGNGPPTTNAKLKSNWLMY